MKIATRRKRSAWLGCVESKMKARFSRMRIEVEEEMGCERGRETQGGGDEVDEEIEEKLGSKRYSCVYTLYRRG